jgi:hypothetical protein
MRQPIRSCTFVDWNSQVHAVSDKTEEHTAETATAALKKVGNKVTRLLTEIAPEARFRLDLRLYAGWTKGFTRSDYFRAVTASSGYFDIDALFPSSRVSKLFSCNKK